MAFIFIPYVFEVYNEKNHIMLNIWLIFQPKFKFPEGKKKCRRDREHEGKTRKGGMEEERKRRLSEDRRQTAGGAGLCIRA